MKTFKRFALLAAVLLVSVMARAGYYRGATLRDHGHTAANDGGELANPSITGGNIEPDSVRTSSVALTGADVGGVPYALSGGTLATTTDMLFDPTLRTLTIKQVTSSTSAIAGTASVVATSTASTTSGTSITIPTLVSDFADLGIFVCLTYPHNGVTPTFGVSSGTLNGDSFVRISSASSTNLDHYEVFQLLDPSTGTHDAVFYTTSEIVTYLAASVYVVKGLNQSSPVGATNTSIGSGYATESTVNVTGTAGGLIIDVAGAVGAAAGPYTASSGQTANYPNLSNGWSSFKTAADGANVVTWADSSEAGMNVIHFGFALNPAMGSTTTYTTTQSVIGPGTISLTGSISNYSHVVATKTSVAYTPAPYTKAVFYTLPFTESRDTQSEWNGTTFTATTAGNYLLSVKMGWEAFSNCTGTGISSLFVSKNGGGLSGSPGSTTTEGTAYINRSALYTDLSTSYYLEAGDTLSVSASFAGTDDGGTCKGDFMGRLTVDRLP